MNKPTTMILAMIALLLIVPFAAAAQPGVLSAAYDNLKCRADFVTRQMNDSSLSEQSSKLNTDVASLQSYVDKNDAEGFRVALKAMQSDFSAAREAMKNVRLSKRNATRMPNETRLALRDQSQALRTSFDSCQFTAEKARAQAKINDYTSELDRYTQKIANMSPKVDTSGMTAVVNDAQTTVVVPLQNAVASATNGTALAKALSSYCLYNGCKNGLDFHLAAKYDYAKLNAISALVLGDKTQFQTDMGTAKSALDAIADKQYSEGSNDQVWKPLQAAAKDLRDLLNAVKKTV